MGSPNIFALTDASFESEVLQSPVPVLVDLWAEWCGPCKMLAPVLDELADEYQGKAKIGKVDIEENQRLAATYSISAIPNLLLFKNGQVVDQTIGMASAQKLKTRLDQAISGA